MIDRFSSRHPKIVTATQLLSAAFFAVCSIWYGAWYPDAQAEMHTALKIADPKAGKPSFWEVSSSNIHLTSPVGYTSLFLVLGLLSGVGSGFNARRMGEIKAELEALQVRESEFKAEQESHADTQRYYYESLKDHLIGFFCKSIDNFDETCRASVYRHDADAKAFRLVFRHCQITRFESRGRVSIPDGEGVVGATLANGDSVYISGLPEKRNKAYQREINRQLNLYGASISEHVIGRLRMPSRSYFGYAIRDVISREKFAVLILESTNPDHFDPESLALLLGGDGARIAMYVRHIAHLDSKLNPYGGT